MGNTNSETQQQQQQIVAKTQAAALLSSPITIFETDNGNKRKSSSSLIGISPNRKSKRLTKHQQQQQQQQQQVSPTKLYKAWDIVNLCTYNEWINNSNNNNNTNNEYNYRNVNKLFSCKGKCRETCANGFCLYSSLNKRTQRNLLSNRKFNYYSNDNNNNNNNSNDDDNSSNIRFRFKNFFLFNKNKYVNNIEAKKIMDHFKYNHLPAMFSAFQHYNVKGLIKGNFNNSDCNTNEAISNLLLINIYSEIIEKTRFVLINLKTNKFLSIFGDYHGYINASEVYAAWSPDATKLLIRLSSHYHSNDFENFVADPIVAGVAPVSSSFIDYYDISQREGKLLKRFKYFHKTAIFTFDPTFKHSKLAITSYYQESSNSMTIVDLNDKCDKLTRVVASSQSLVPDLSRSACDLRFSLDGSYVVLTIGDNICCCRALPHAYSEFKYLIFATSTCQLLKAYTSHLATCSIHMCPLNYLPKISMCQSRLAIPNKNIQSTNDNEELEFYNRAVKRTLTRNNRTQPTASTEQHQITSAIGLSIASTNVVQNKLLCNLPILKLNSNSSSNLNNTTKPDLTFIKIVHVPCDTSLKNRCRIIINRNIKNTDSINDLLLPESIKAYLKYTPQRV